MTFALFSSHCLQLRCPTTGTNLKSVLLGLRLLMSKRQSVASRGRLIGPHTPVDARQLCQPVTSRGRSIVHHIPINTHQLCILWPTGASHLYLFNKGAASSPPPHVGRVAVEGPPILACPLERSPIGLSMVF